MSPLTYWIVDVVRGVQLTARVLDAEHHLSGHLTGVDFREGARSMIECLDPRFALHGGDLEPEEVVMGTCRADDSIERIAVDELHGASVAAYS
ncbi:MAG: hypothetical protein KIT31_01330 [Deltaproteobacteria bacterium]|nr:hypothetical protein [Deltaproteobacteria bacterium]